ncbi:MAG: hypothetical protein AVDCRST_MAG90-2964, partial [uncultured Microvirga sp.]
EAYPSQRRHAGALPGPQRGVRSRGRNRRDRGSHGGAYAGVHPAGVARQPRSGPGSCRQDGLSGPACAGGGRAGRGGVGRSHLPSWPGAAEPETRALPVRGGL